MDIETNDFENQEQETLHNNDYETSNEYDEPSQTEAESLQGEESEELSATESFLESISESSEEEEPEAQLSDRSIEEEILEPIKSERSRERIQGFMNEHKELKQHYEALNSDLSSIQQAFRESGMNQQDFEATLQYSKLLNSQDKNDLQIAWQMVEKQRLNLAKRMGMAMPGVDPLENHDDLKNLRDNEFFENEQLLLETARLRELERQQRQSQQIEEQSRYEMQAYQNNVQQASSAAYQHLQKYSAQRDFKPKMEQITKYFSDPNKLNQFVATYDPHQWIAQIDFMYENISVPQRSYDPQPIRSRPTTSGSVASNPNMTSTDRLMSHIDNMGI